MKSKFKNFTRYCIIALIQSLFVLTGCDKSSDNEETPDSMIDVTANVSIQEASDNPINMKWAANDKIIVNYNSFSVVSGIGSGKASFIGKINKDANSVTSYFPLYVHTDAVAQFINYSIQKQNGNSDDRLKWYLYMTASYTGDLNKITLDFQYQVSVLDFKITNNTGSDVKIEAVSLEVTENDAFYEKVYPYATDGNVKGKRQGLVIDNPIITKNNELFTAHMVASLTSETILDGKTIKITVYTDKGNFTFTETIDKSFEKGKQYEKPLKME